MKNNLKAVKVESKTGQELFLQNDKDLEFNLMDFWSWSASDLLNNTQRGILAEYIVMKDLDIQKTTRTEWDAYDLKMENGLKIEVKSASYLQSWEQTKFSSISFGIAPTKSWDSETNLYSKEIKRQADYYVFCLLEHKDKLTINPLHLDQWIFYVLPTHLLNQHSETQATIGINSLLNLNPVKCKFGEIKKAIK